MKTSIFLFRSMAAASHKGEAHSSPVTNAIRVMVGVLATFSLSACDAVDPASVCASEETQGHIVRMIVEHLDPSIKNMQLWAVTYQGGDKKTGIIRCQGQLAFGEAHDSNVVRFARQRTADGSDYVYYIETADLAPLNAYVRIYGELVNYPSAYEDPSPRQSPTSEPDTDASSRTAQSREPAVDAPAQKAPPRHKSSASAEAPSMASDVSIAEHATQTEALNTDLSARQVAAVPDNAPSSPKSSTDEPPVISNPDWARRPDGEDIFRYYPAEAQRLNVGGHATIQCKVRANGTLTDCFIVDEKPVGYGFGDATLQAARLFRMRPRMIDGMPTGGAIVRIPIRWIPTPR